MDKDTYGEIQEFTSEKFKRPEKLSEYVEDAIKKAIIAGSLRSNQVLSTEKLAEVFNVSRMPVREALTNLKSIGVIDIIDGKGSLIKKLTQDEYTQVCLARRIIEPSIAEIAASKCTAEQVGELEEIYRVSKECLSEGELGNYTLMNYDFHIKIAEICNVKYLLTFSEILNILMALEWSTRINDTEYWRMSIKEHLNILESIKRKDPLSAKHFMLLDLMNYEVQNLSAGENNGLKELE
jgi:DNA-binding GntR family transcriptional regulator